MAEGEETIGVETIDPETARQLLAELDQQDQEQEEQEKKQEEEEREAIKAPGQVVELPEPVTPTERPRDAKFVAEDDSKVEKETKKQGRYDDRAGRAARCWPCAPDARGDVGATHAARRGGVTRRPPARAGAAPGPRGRLRPRPRRCPIPTGSTRCNPGCPPGAHEIRRRRPAPARRVPRHDAAHAQLDAAGAGHRRRHPGSPARRRRRRQHRAERQGVEVRLVLQPHQAPGGPALAAGGAVREARSHRAHLRQRPVGDDAAGLAQARRQPEWRHRGQALGAGVPGRRGDRGHQARLALPQPAHPAGRRRTG